MRTFARRTLLAALAVAAVAGCSQAQGGSGAAANGDIVIGPTDAKVTVTEYASPTCPACAVFNETVYPEFKKKYVDTGQVRFVFREAPIAGAVDAAAFLMARCVGTGEKYLGVIDTLLRSQGELRTNGGDARAWLLNTARSAGMTEEQFQRCVSDEDALKALNARWEKNSRADNVQATPTILINGERKFDSVPTLAQLDAAIAEARAK
jgi:protein-disulfide isomerase